MPTPLISLAPTNISRAKLNSVLKNHFRKHNQRLPILHSQVLDTGERPNYLLIPQAFGPNKYIYIAIQRPACPYSSRGQAYKQNPREYSKCAVVMEIFLKDFPTSSRWDSPLRRKGDFESEKADVLLIRPGILGKAKLCRFWGFQHEVGLKLLRSNPNRIRLCSILDFAVLSVSLSY